MPPPGPADSDPAAPVAAGDSSDLMAVLRRPTTGREAMGESADPLAVLRQRFVRLYAGVLFVVAPVGLLINYLTSGRAAGWPVLVDVCGLWGVSIAVWWRNRRVVQPRDPLLFLLAAQLAALVLVGVVPGGLPMVGLMFYLVALAGIAAFLVGPRLGGIISAVNVAGVWILTRSLSENLSEAEVALVHGAAYRAVIIIIIVGVVGAYFAVQLRNAVTHLRVARDRLRDIIDGAADAFVSLDARRHVDLVNPAAARLFGLLAPELVGRPFLALPAWGDEARARLEAVLDTAVAGGEALATEVEVLTPSGHVRHAEVLARSVRRPDGGRSVQAVLRDTTERRRLEAELRRSQRLDAVGRLAGGIAHDFNNLLTVMLANSDYIVEESTGRADLAEVKDAASVVGETARRAATLTRQLLAFSRRQILAPRRIDLGEVLRGLELMLTRVLGEDVHLALRVGPEPAFVLADPAQIEQVIMNLVVNARAAMPRGGDLVVEIKPATIARPSEANGGAPPGPYVALVVADAGIGMTDETMAHAFEPFFTTREAGGGTGMGLATVHGIVKQSRGYIGVLSVPGAGTTFTVLLPVSPEGEGDSVRERRTPLRTATNCTILLVEDDDAVRRTAARILGHAGHRVIEAANAAEALQRLGAASGPVDVLVSDLVMPGRSGRELAQELRQERPLLRVVLMSGYADQEDSAAPLADAFVAKPFTPQALLDAVTTAQAARR